MCYCWSTSWSSYGDLDMAALKLLCVFLSSSVYEEVGGTHWVENARTIFFRSNVQVPKSISLGCTKYF